MVLSLINATKASLDGKVFSPRKIDIIDIIDIILDYRYNYTLISIKYSV